MPLSALEIFNALIFFVLLVVYAILCGLGRLSISSKGFRLCFYGIFWTSAIVCFLGGLFFKLLPLVSVNHDPKYLQAVAALQPFALGLLIFGILGAAFLTLPVRQLLAKIMPLNPESPMHVIGLIALIPFVEYFIGISATYSPEQLIKMMQNANILTNTSTVQLYFVAIVLISVGWGYARNRNETFARLGLLYPTKRQQLISVLAAIFMFAFFTVVMDPLLRALLPGDMAFQETIMKLSQPGRETGNIPFEIFLISLFAGIGEELFFRGLLLPIVGLIPAALLFSLIHIQYGIGPGFIIVFLSGLILGHLRQRYSTSVAILTHVLYDMLAFSAVFYLMK